MWAAGRKVAGEQATPPAAAVAEEEEEEEVLCAHCWAGSLPGSVMLPKWRTGSGWASVLKTQVSNGIRSSLENSRYRYLGGGGVFVGCGQ